MSACPPPKMSVGCMNALLMPDLSWASKSDVGINCSFYHYFCKVRPAAGMGCPSLDLASWGMAWAAIVLQGWKAPPMAPHSAFSTLDWSLVAAFKLTYWPNPRGGTVTL